MVLLLGPEPLEALPVAPAFSARLTQPRPLGAARLLLVSDRSRASSATLAPPVHHAVQEAWPLGGTPGGQVSGLGYWTGTFSEMIGVTSEGFAANYDP